MVSTKLPSDDWVETRFREDDHPEWQRTFAADVRRNLVDEDLWAGRSISAVLVAIVSLGLILTVGATVAMILRYGTMAKLAWISKGGVP